METIWMTWRGSELIEFGRFNKNAGNTWTWSSLSTADYDASEFNRSVADGGATLTLLGCGLMGLGALRRKLRR
jgi:hypothetical protein